MKKLLLASALALCGCDSNTPTGPVTGDVIFGFDASKPIPVENSRLNYPEDAVETKDGSIYVSDTHLHVIRKITNGTMEPFAGTFEAGFNGDGARESVTLNTPTGLLLSEDEKYLTFSDSGNGLLRRINLETGQISTIAGKLGEIELPKAGEKADQTPIGYVAAIKHDEQGNICFPSSHIVNGIVLDGGTYCIDSTDRIRINEKESDQPLQRAKDILLDKHGMYATELNKLYRFQTGKKAEHVDLQSDYGKGIVQMDKTLFVGNHTVLYAVDEHLNATVVASGFANISNVKPYHKGLLITDSDQGVLYSFDGTNKSQLTGTSADAVGALTSVAQYGEGKLLILDNQRPRIFIHDIATGKSTVWAGTGEQGWASINVDKMNTNFYYPTSIAVDADLNVYIAEQHRIMKIDAAGQMSRFAGYEKDGDIDSDNPEEARFRSIGGMSVGPDGALYVSDTYNSKIRKISKNGKVSTFAGTGKHGSPSFGKAADQVDLNHPLGVLALPGGDVLIADSWNNAVVKVDRQGVIHPFAGKPVQSMYQGLGQFSGDDSLALNAGLNTPANLAVDKHGNVYIADHFNHRIRMVSTNGKILTLAGEAQGYAPHGKRLNFPNGVQVIDGFLYVADSGNRLVARYQIN